MKKKLSIVNSYYRNRELIRLFINRDITSRYKGSQLGLAWTAINPIVMLSIYTLVFSQIFKARWGVSTENQGPVYFAINLFAGLIVFNIFAECATRAPTLITGNPNYVKKIVFPLEILGTMVTGSALFHALTSTSILLILKIIVDGTIPFTVLMLPMVWGPLILGCLGLTWLLATIGVFIRDVNQLINSVVSMCMFLSPIFYPSSAIPQDLIWLARINPLAQTIEQTRQILIEGIAPSGLQIAVQFLISIGWCEITLRILKNAQSEFGDIL
ncbi:ABC transporter, membrane component [Prochlorococcus marinus str. MIT 9313]|uniref:Transport permease protein n=1 Tax=Prochlorococcus marinus (strain MIT 9313) TaxID=74547 RepID=Q7V950_PROMM|nr:ABC transporter permease [Prochlorococcus marinus]CAE20284.1 ABC transporter, membrane component [Prochlorococcus marinus str. MIT 9313]